MIRTSYYLDIQDYGGLTVRGNEIGVTLTLDFNVGPDALDGTEIELTPDEAEDLLRVLHIATGRGDLD